MADGVLEPTRIRTVTAVAFVVLAALLWIAPPAAAQECPPLSIEPPDGQYPGEAILIVDHSGDLAGVALSFSLGGELLATQGYTDSLHEGSFVVMATVPNLATGVHTFVYSITVPMPFPFDPLVTYCQMDYTVLSGLIAILPDPSTDATIPLDTIDTIAPTTTTTTSTTTTTTTTTLPPPPPPPTTTTITTPPPTTPGPTTAAPASTAPSTPVVPGASGSTTVAPTTTTVAVETTTTLAEPASTVSDTTLVAAAPQSDDGGTSSDQMLIGLVIGVGAAGLLVLAWALGRRGRTTPGSYQPPPPPPPR